MRRFYFSNIEMRENLCAFKRTELRQTTIQGSEIIVVTAVQSYAFSGSNNSRLVIVRSWWNCCRFAHPPAAQAARKLIPDSLTVPSRQKYLAGASVVFRFRES